MVLAAVPPSRLRLPARLGTAIYAALIVNQAAAHAGGSAARLRIAAALTTMHVTWTVGFLAGIIRFVPRRKILQATKPAPIARKRFKNSKSR
jgi:hypothetical protein